MLSSPPSFFPREELAGLGFGAGMWPFLLLAGTPQLPASLSPWRGSLWKAEKSGCEPSAGTWAASALIQELHLPWIQSRPKSKGGLFLKRRPGGTQSALSFGVEAFKGLFCLNILLQEREAPNQTFLKHEFQVALKEQFVWFPSHPVPAQWGLGHWALGFGGGSTPFRLTVQTHQEVSQHQLQPEGLWSQPGPQRAPRGQRTPISEREGAGLSSAAFPLRATHSFLSSLYS